MHRFGHQPQIIVELTEEEEEEEEEEVEEEEDDEEKADSSKSDEIKEIDDVAMPLRPNDLFPYRRRNSPFLKLSDDGLAKLRVLNEATSSEGGSVAISPASSMTSMTTTVSRHEFSTFRIDDETMKGMMNIGKICERNKNCVTGKYVNTATMANYTVTEYILNEQNINREKISGSIDTLCQLRHRRLGRIYGYHWRSTNHLFIFRTFVPNGTISDKLKRGALSEELSLKYFGQLIDGLQFMHDRRICHGKVSPSNILVTISNDILLADPHIDGLSSGCDHFRRALLSSPPEAFRDRNSFPSLTTAADIWAVGCTLVAMVTRFPPFSDQFLQFQGDQLHQQLISSWASNQLNYASITLVPSASKEIMDIVDMIFVKRPEQRPTASQLSETFGAKSRKTSVRFSLTSLANRDAVHLSMDRFYENRDDDEQQNQLEQLIEKHENRQINQEGVFAFIWWILSRILIFTILLLKWIGMVLCAALSLALVAGSVFLSIFIIYNGIEVICQCRLNEGFIVLIALILLPIIILLTTLCCNNSLEKYNNEVESGKVEESKFVMRTPEKNVILFGYIVIEGKKRIGNERKIGLSEGMAQFTNRGDFLSGVARIA